MSPDAVVRAAVRVGDSRTGGDGRERRARDGALVRRRAGRRRPPTGTVRGPQRRRRRYARQRRLHAVDGETVPETETRRASRRPTGAAHFDRGITLREGEPEPLLVRFASWQPLFFRGRNG
ncbi:MAG: hypothetical protein J07HQW2_03903 [Haloquadratum walsbyi J07HQW2]|uniref:Uncharacterized protein n=1 Tax=Haloquadratum walsbyi J07HQW2 TaxID=1238425 RepID=U1PUF1_9EURY|nr:MAG: hypothetical protein J07HQW2_03903 [Haloquadratum walsbyi J07HQW2]